MVTLEEALHGARKKISFRRQDSSKTETYEVKIPKGVREGQRIRLAGQGAVGSRKDLSGDLYLVVRLAQHPDYRIEGDDLIHELELPAWEAVLGTETHVPTPDGSVRLKIPPGTQSGQKLRLRGRGLPMSGDRRGDFYVQVEIVVPKTVSEAARPHWEALAKLGL
jgi:curved DNA-binding protein